MGGEFATARRGLASADRAFIVEKRGMGVGVSNIARMVGCSQDDVRAVPDLRVVAPAIAAPAPELSADPIDRIARIAVGLDEVALRRALALIAGLIAAEQGQEVAETAMTNVVNAARRASAPSVQNIVGRIAVAYGVTPEEIMGRETRRGISDARQAAYSEVKSLRPWLSLPALGRIFGGRDHTTILHGIRAHAARQSAEVSA
jgi:hypothetical protein